MLSDYIKRKRILLVDDEPDLLDMVVSILKEEGYEIYGPRRVWRKR